MTLIAAWAGLDSRSVASVYIASDSRISWTPQVNYNHGKKVFASQRTPDIFGYCGDVLFPLLPLDQLVTMIDNGLLFEEGEDYPDRQKAILYQLKKSFDDYPHDNPKVMGDVVEIFYCGKDNTNEFHFKKISWTRTLNRWIVQDVDVLKDRRSYVLVASGTGQPEFQKKYSEYLNQPGSVRTSRCVFQTFCNVLENIQNPLCGGAPQLVGLYRRPQTNGMYFGIIYKGYRYFQGLCINTLPNLHYKKIQWRNEWFELCDAETCKICDGAQRQPFWH